MFVHPVGKSEDAEKQENRDIFKTKNEAQQIFVTASKGRQRGVERGEYPAADSVFMSQEKGGESRGQREGVERGNGNGKRDREGELAEQDSGGAGKECYRNEDRDENQGSRDDRASDFAHGDGRGVVRFRNSFGDGRLPVFDAQNGVLADKAGGGGGAKTRA